MRRRRAAAGSTLAEKAGLLLARAGRQDGDAPYGPTEPARHVAATLASYAT